MEDVLLVDDERPVLEGLLSALDWAEYGFKQIYTAQSTQEALRLLETKHIDLLLTDIMMPGMNGLEMLSIVRKRFTGTRCVLLSAHSKFEYAKEALKLGVENYLLKPIDVAELRETVYRCVRNIDYTNAISNDLYDRNILLRWLHGRISSDELVEHSRYTALNVLLRRYRVVYICAGRKTNRLMEKIGESLGMNYTAHPLLLDEETGILLIGGREVTDDALHEAVHDLLVEAPDALVVCGSQATGNSEVVQSRANAVHTLAYAKLAGMTGWVSSDTLDRESMSIRVMSELEDIVFRERPEKQAQNWIEQRLQETVPEAYPRLYASVCLTLKRVISERDIPQAQQFVFVPFSAPSTEEHTATLLIEAILSTARLLRQGMKDLSPITVRVLQYVLENLNGSLSIKQFADQAKMNANYIGRLFKEEMGVYFSDHVRLVRIGKAKTLLENTTLSVSDIARQVGIYDISYFTQCFKKEVRMSPMKYRQQKKQDGLLHPARDDKGE